MRKGLAILILAALITVLALPMGCACCAVEIPYVVIGDDIWLLDKSTSAKLFLLPSTYYARIDNLDDNFYYITFNGISGKVERAKVSTVGYSGEAGSTLQELTVDPKYYVFTEIKLLSTLGANNNDIPVPVTASLIFLGKYPSNEMYYYVRYNDVCGYIKAEFTSKPNLSIEKFVPQTTETAAKSDAEAGDAKTKNANLIKILVITSLSVVLLILLVVIFKPGKNKKNRYYYEE